MKSAFIVNFNSDFQLWASFARDEKIDGLEVMFHTPAPGDFGGVKEKKRIIDDFGVDVAAIGLWGLGLADTKDSGSADTIKRAIDYGAALESYCIFTGAGDPEGSDPVGALSEVYGEWSDLAEKAGMKLAVYLGHKGSFIFTEELLAEACKRVPNLGLKLDPIGIIRNLKADPYDVMFRCAGNLIHFHVKDRLILTDGEIEPPPGLGELNWGHFFAIMHHHLYDEYISVEPHGGFWGKQDEMRKKYIRLTLKHLSQFMI